MQRISQTRCPKCGRETMRGLGSDLKPTGKRLCVNLSCPQMAYYPEVKPLKSDIEVLIDIVHGEMNREIKTSFDELVQDALQIIIRRLEELGGKEQ